MNIEKRIFTEKELSYEQLTQIKEHAKKYDYAVDKKNFLKNITPYEQKLVLLETKNPFEVLTYLDELDLTNSKIILEQLTSDEIRKIIDEFSSEDKRRFYASFSDLSVINQFIINDVNSKQHISDLKTERKVDILNSATSETKEAAAKIYDTVSDDEKEFVSDNIITSEAISVAEETNLEIQTENEIVEEEIKIEEEQQDKLKIEDEEEQQEEKETKTKQELEEKQQEELTENKINNSVQDEINYNKVSIPKVENLDLEENDIKLNLTPELEKEDVSGNFKIVNEEKNEENLQLFQVAKVNCEHELIKSVINNKKEKVEEKEQETYKKAL